MQAVVHTADVQDRDGGVLLMATLFGMYPFLLSKRCGVPTLRLTLRGWWESGDGAIADADCRS